MYHRIPTPLPSILLLLALAATGAPAPADEPPAAPQVQQLTVHEPRARGRTQELGIDGPVQRPDLHRVGVRTTDVSRQVDEGPAVGKKLRVAVGVLAAVLVDRRQLPRFAALGRDGVDRSAAGGLSLRRK